MTDLFEASGTPDETSLRDELLTKWKDKPAAELLEAKINSDLYIKTLERQKDELRADYLSQREELLAKAKFEDLLTRFESKDNNLQVAHTPANEVESPKYDPKEIENLINKRMSENKSLERETENAGKVQAKLKERYGNNYHSILEEQRNTLGLSTEDVNALAKKSPEAFFRLMGLQGERNVESFQTPPRSGQRSDSFAPKGQTKRDWNYYQELKKTNPTLYLDPKLSVQMHNDAIEQGEAFYGQS